MADASVLARAVRAAEEVVAAVRVAFGPAGRGVLIQGPTGALTITRGALDILEAAFPPSASSSTSPEVLVLLQGARSLRQQTGDGVKSFLLTTLALLRGLRDLDVSTSPAVRFGLSRLDAALSTAVPRVAEQGRCAPDVALVAESVLVTRFTAGVAAAALPPIASLLCGQDALVLRRHLDVLCRRRHAAGRGVADSAIRQGVVVDGMLRFLDGTATVRRRIVVLAGDEGDDDVDVDAAVTSMLEDTDVDASRALLITSAALSDVSLFAVRRRGAVVLHGVDRDVERFLLDWTLRAAGAEDDVEVRVERGGAWLGLADVRQLQVHAPTQQLADQLGSAVRDVVQLLCFAGAVTVPGDVALCQGGGSLERHLHRALGGTPLGRAELLHWHQHRHQQHQHGVNQHPAVDALVTAFRDVDVALKKVTAEAVAAVPRALPPQHFLDPPLELVALRVAVLQHALATVGTLLSVDQVLSAKRPAAS